MSEKKEYHIGPGGRCLFYERVNCLSKGEKPCTECYFYPKERKDIMNNVVKKTCKKCKKEFVPEVPTDLCFECIYDEQEPEQEEAETDYGTPG